MDDDLIRRHDVRVRGARDGQPMLFVHGFGCDQSLWRFVTPAFESTHRVITFDYVGAGGSDRAAYDPAKYSSLDGYAADILDICHALDLRDVILVGHSVSSIVSILAANREPERFSDLVLITPSPRYIDDLPDYRGGFSDGDIDGLLQLMDANTRGWATYLAPIVMGNPEHPEMASSLEETFCSIDPVMARQFASVTFRGDNRADLEAVRIPTLIIACTDDAVAPQVVTDFVHSRIEGSVLHMIEATGHCPHVSHPDETIAVIQGRLAQRREAGAIPAR